MPAKKKYLHNTAPTIIEIGAIREEHTTIEEMNALNEELQSTNEELQSRIKELAQKNAEAETLSNCLISIQDSVPVALLVVGKQLQLQRYKNI